MKPALLATWAYCVLGACKFGWDIGAVNLPINYITCWLEGQKYNATFSDWQTACENSNNLASENNEIFSDGTSYWSLCVALFGVGAAVAGIFTGVLNDKLGRKNLILYNAILGVFSSSLMGASRVLSSPGLLLTCRILVGVNAAISVGTAPPYLSEIAPAGKLGLFGISFQLGVSTAMLLSQIIGLPWLLGTNSGWDVVLGLSAVFPAIQIILYFFVAESPKYLMSKGEMGKAAGEQNRLFDDKLEIITNDDLEATNSVSFLSVFKIPKVFKALQVGAYLNLTQQLCGANAVMFYSTQWFINAGLDVSLSSIATCGVGLFMIIGNLTAIKLIDKTGRRPLMLVTLVLLTFCMVLMTLFLRLIAGVKNDDNIDIDETLGNFYSFALILMTLFFMLAFANGPGPIPYLIMSEMVDVEYRSICQSICGFTNWVGFFLVALFFPSLNSLLGDYVFLLFAGYCALSFVLMFFRMPETKSYQ